LSQVYTIQINDKQIQ
jgi:TP901 family phage tail tape measure protein